MLTDGPVVGIVIPTFKGEAHIAKTLASIQGQTYKDWECVVVNDGSPDSTNEVVTLILARDQRIRLVNKENGGVSSARNRGFDELSRSVIYVTFMDHDDIWTPSALETLVRELEVDPDAVGVYALADMIDVEDRPIEPGGFSTFLRNRVAYDGVGFSELAPSAPTEFTALMYFGNFYPPGIILTRRFGYEKVGEWDTSFRFVQDWDMNIRLSRIGYFRFVDRVILYYRRHDGNATDDHRLNVREKNRLMHKTYFSPENRAEHREVLRGGWKAFQRRRIVEKRAQIREHFENRRLVRAAILIMHISVHYFRYVRGRPTGNGI